MTDNDSVGCDCKVGRAVDAYDLPGLNRELRDRRDREEASLRELADVTNTRILESALEHADADVVGDASSVYEALTGDDVAPERRADVRDQLTYAGVDVEAVTDDFVSHQTVRAHLSDCLDVDTSRRGVTDVDEGRDVIEWARGRDEHIVEQTLDQLRRRGALDVGALDVTHTVRVTCTECGASYPVETLLDRGHCECREP